MKHISLRMAAALLVFALCAPVFSQRTDASAVMQEGAQAELPAQTAASDITLATPEDSIRFDWNAADTAPATLPAQSPSSFGLFVRMILALAVVAALIYGVVFLMKRGLRPRASDDPFLRRVSQIALAPGKSVQIVTLFNHAYLLGVTDNAVNVIGEITDKELVDSMNVYADQQENAPRPRSFEDILNIFMGRRTGTPPETAFTQSAQTATESLQRQRERLQSENGDNA